MKAEVKKKRRTPIEWLKKYFLEGNEDCKSFIDITRTGQKTSKELHCVGVGRLKYFSSVANIEIGYNDKSRRNILCAPRKFWNATRFPEKLYLLLWLRKDNNLAFL